MLVKFGVDISRLNWEIRKSLNVVNKIYTARGLEAVITSTYEGNHSAGSYHYGNDAYDLRLMGDDELLADLLQKALGNRFYVLVEGTHIHVQRNRRIR